MYNRPDVNLNSTEKFTRDAKSLEARRVNEQTAEISSKFLMFNLPPCTIEQVKNLIIHDSPRSNEIHRLFF